MLGKAIGLNLELRYHLLAASNQPIQFFGGASMKAKIPLLVLMGLAGCNQAPNTTAPQSPSAAESPAAKPAVDELGCAGGSALALMKKMLADKVIDQVKAEPGNGQLQKADMAKVRAVVGAIQLDIVDVRTTSNDPNSSKKFCEANLKVVVPDNFVAEANEVARMKGYKSVAEMADASNIEFGANRFEEVIGYNVQPTDSRDKIYGTLDKVKVAPDFLTYIAYFASLRTGGSEALSIAGAKKPLPPQAEAAVQAAQQEAASAAAPNPAPAPAATADSASDSRFADVKGKMARVPMASELNIRGGPNADFPLVAQLLRGATVKFLGDVATRTEKSGTKAVWAHIELVSGKYCQPERLDPAQGCLEWLDARPVSGWVNAGKLEF